jgi:SAM-dependent methyltransferase
MDWGEIFTDPEMQALAPNPELMSLLPEFKEAGCRRALDAGCGAGRNLLPLAHEGFRVWGVDREAPVLRDLKIKLESFRVSARLAAADLAALPFPSGAFSLVVSINAITHGHTAQFRAYCRELDRVLAPGGQLFLYLSPREAGEMMRGPHARELEPGTLVDIATPDGALVHHFPTPEELRGQFPGYRVRRGETILAPIPFMGNVELPQLVFWAIKGR